MVAAYKNFGAKRKPRRARSSLFARCSVAFAALGKDRGLEGNINRRGRRVSQRNDWGVAQRYIYSPYGSMIVLNADFSTPPVGTQPISDYLYQGMTLDAVTGLYYARNRNYSPSLGVWISQDPAQYVNGANTYQMEMSGPVGSVDASGLQVYFGPGSGWPQEATPPPQPLSGAAVPATVAGLLAGTIKDRGHFGGSLQRHTNVSSFLQLNFVPNEEAKCHCKKIEFIQFVQVSYVALAFGLDTYSSPGWELDDKPNGDPPRVPPPFYPYQFPGHPRGAYMTDTPTASSVLGATQYSLFQEVYYTFAICTQGTEAGHAYGQEAWGRLFILSVGRPMCLADRG